MKTALFVFLLLTLTSSALLAQTKTPAKPATTTATKPATATKPEVKPATSATQPAVKTTPAARKSTAKPATKGSTTRPAPAKPASQPTPDATPEAPAKPGGATSFAKGTVAVNLGVGLGVDYDYAPGFGGSVQSTPAITLSVEKGIVESVGPGIISVGGLVGYNGYSYEWNVSGDRYKASWKNLIVTARGAYHYNFTNDPKIDTYAGVSLGARIEDYSDNYKGSIGGSYGGTYLTSGVFLGGRYFFSDTIGAFAELGYDTSYWKLGFSAKF